MPEGDVVKRTAQRLDQALGRSRLSVADLRWPSLATLDLRGRTFLEARSRGKHLLVRVEGGLTLHTHLRMEGSWRIHRSPAPGLRRQDIRAVLGNEQWTAIGHRLGLLEALPTAEEHRVVGHLGPDVLGEDWDLDHVLSTVRAVPDRAIGEVLLDQRILAGVGTFFMCEICFLTGITPWTPVGDVPDVERLLQRVQTLMAHSYDTGAQVTTGRTAPGEHQWVHGRSGRPCRRCGTTLRVAELGAAPTARVAFYCPRCQRGPTPTDSGAAQRPLGSSRDARGRPARRYA